MALEQAVANVTAITTQMMVDQIEGDIAMRVFFLIVSVLVTILGGSILKWAKHEFGEFWRLTGIIITSIGLIGDAISLTTLIILIIQLFQTV
jgi:hypothetical protein